MCRSDVTLFTLQWSEGSRFPRADFSQEHEYVDFDAVNRWAAERRVEAGTPGILTHSKFGKLPNPSLNQLSLLCLNSYFLLFGLVILQKEAGVTDTLATKGVAYKEGEASRIGGSEDTSPTIVTE